MTHEEFASWLRDEVGSERMTQPEMNDLLHQKELFENSRSIIEAENNRRVVGYVADQRWVADSTHGLIDSAKARFPDRMIYFEPIGFTLL
jgi:hypothetical protein